MGSGYRYGGAEALVALHARYMREFLATWRRADEAGIEMPNTSDPSYASRDALLAHVLGCAAHYLIWMCERLHLPRPGVEANPPADGLAPRADAYLEAVLAAWELPLRTVSERQADRNVYVSRWGVPFTIDSMLEHAVMHPIRHSYQLERLMAEQAGRR